jgi:hypothetical protein
MKLLLLIIAVFVVTACAGANPGEMSTQDLWNGYCASDGHTKDPRTGVTVEQWDDEATAAGHGGVSAEDKLGPNPGPPRGC